MHTFLKKKASRDYFCITIYSIIMAGNKGIQNKKDIARQLFVKGDFTQIEIAEKVGVSKVTINKWIKGENWDKEKISISATRQEQLKRLYDQLAEINKFIADKPEGTRFASPAEADSMNKIAKAIEKLEKETSLSDVITVITDILEWIRPQDLNKTKELSGIFDLFIKSKLQ